jgi:hypothetical protein
MISLGVWKTYAPHLLAYRDALMLRQPKKPCSLGNQRPRQFKPPRAPVPWATPF